MTNESESRLYVGISVGKTSLEVALDDEAASVSFPNDAQGIAALQAQLEDLPLPVALVLLEAPDGLEKHCAYALALAGVEVVVINPRQSHDFAKAMGYPARTERIPAQALSYFARMLHRNVAQCEELLLKLPWAEQQQLDELVGRRAQLISMRTAEDHRLEQARHYATVKSIREVIRTLDKQIDNLDKDIGGRLKMHFAYKLKLLEGMRGIGASVLPELRQLMAVVRPVLA
jgi:transposase